MFSKIRPFIFKLDPELAHDLAIKALKTNLIVKDYKKNELILKTKLFGKEIPNPIGIAAGFDKNAEVYNPLFKLGFGFVEVGTVTPLSQYGNPKPRVFRLEEDCALINRLGFNNNGADDARSRIIKKKPIGMLGVNIGPNWNSENKIEDYLNCLRKFHDIADYITINISSPNTENLRDFHNNEELKNLLESENLNLSDFLKTEIVYSEIDAVSLVLSDQADVTLGLASEAEKYKLKFIPVVEERFDLVIDRFSWFENPFQKLFQFSKTIEFIDIASRLKGYNIKDLGVIHFNSK